MLRKRLIPCLLLVGEGLYKTVRFKKPRYIGDPINAVKILNDKEVDELVFLDIRATREGAEPNYKLLESIASEAFMPFSYGGGVTNCKQVERLLKLGIEKIIINSAAYDNDKFVAEAVRINGSSSIVGCIDYKKRLFGGQSTYSHSGSESTKCDPLVRAQQLEYLGVGEILLHSIDRDGCMNGFDLETLCSIASNVSVPVVPVGGASSLLDCRAAFDVGASAVAAGSLFVFHGKHNAVLITYPGVEESSEIFK